MADELVVVAVGHVDEDLGDLPPPVAGVEDGAAPGLRHLHGDGAQRAVARGRDEEERPRPEDVLVLAGLEGLERRVVGEVEGARGERVRDGGPRLLGHPGVGRVVEAEAGEVGGGGAAEDAGVGPDDAHLGEHRVGLEDARRPRHGQHAELVVEVAHVAGAPVDADKLAEELGELLDEALEQPEDVGPDVDLGLQVVDHEGDHALLQRGVGRRGRGRAREGREPGHLGARALQVGAEALRLGHEVAIGADDRVRRVGVAHAGRRALGGRGGGGGAVGRARGAEGDGDLQVELEDVGEDQVDEVGAEGERDLHEADGPVDREVDRDGRGRHRQAGDDGGIVVLVLALLLREGLQALGAA